MMCLTVIGIVLSLTSGTSGSNSSPDYSLANLILMGVYVVATLALVGITIWQARAALAASAKQSQAAIDAVHEQIMQGKQPILIPLSPLPLIPIRVQ
jgi:hypothetical protein